MAPSFYVPPKAVLISALCIILLGTGGCTTLEMTAEASEGFSGVVERLLQDPQWQRRTFWNREKNRLLASGAVLPEVRGEEVLFIFEAPGVRRATIYGDLDRWASPGAEMIPIPGTDVFYLRRRLDPGSRVKYRFLPEGRETAGSPDPWNPKKEVSGRRTDSVLEMPGYGYPETRESGVPKGHLEMVTGSEDWFRNPAGKQRQVWFYQSGSGPRSNRGSRPFLIFGDGRETVEISRLPVVLDNLVASGELEPVCALFISPLNRDGEYLGRQRKDYLEFLKDVLIPRMEARVEASYALGGSPEKRVLIGASNGGEFVLWAGAFYREFSSLIFNQSGVAGNQTTSRWLENSTGSRVYTLVGTFERDFNRGGAESLHRVLRTNPSVVQRLKYLPQGHTWRLWGDGFREGILWLLYGREDPGPFPSPVQE